ncbi:MAG: LPS export ABC transporter periplasmic protein LptC [Bacteroidetes bacterium]|nr:LPS export ABC transporter periplasmic protein LptC [Bacteroidota bacterium]
MKKIILFLVPFIFISCVKKIQPKVLGDEQSSSLPSQESWNSVVTFSDSGRVKAILHSDYIQTSEGSSKKNMKGNIVINLYDENGNHSSTITSNRGTADEETYYIEVEGNVIVTSNNGVVVKTEKMIWNQDRQIVMSETNVKITSSTEIINGVGFESDQFLRDYKVFKVSAISTR